MAGRRTEARPQYDKCDARATASSRSTRARLRAFHRPASMDGRGSVCCGSRLNDMDRGCPACRAFRKVRVRSGRAKESRRTTRPRHVTPHLCAKRYSLSRTGDSLSKAPSPGGKSGLSVAARWFLDRGYRSLLPLEPTCYDLITQSDEGLKKVQVKTTNKLETSGRYFVRLARTIYDPRATSNAGGKYRQAPYTPGMVDYCFIVTGGGSMYLIPFDVVGGRQGIVLDRKYSAFAVT